MSRNFESIAASIASKHGHARTLKDAFEKRGAKTDAAAAASLLLPCLHGASSSVAECARTYCRLYYSYVCLYVLHHDGLPKMGSSPSHIHPGYSICLYSFIERCLGRELLTIAGSWRDPPMRAAVQVRSA